jgi:hypothetical protein
MNGSGMSEPLLRQAHFDVKGGERSLVAMSGNGQIADFYAVRSKCSVARLTGGAQLRTAETTTDGAGTR